MNPAPPTAHRRTRLTLLAVVIAFTLPIFLAWLLSSGVLPWLPKGQVNYGALIEPALDMKDVQFFDDGDALTRLDGRYGQWTLAVILPEECGRECRVTLDHMRRIHFAMREEMGRVHLLAIADRGNPSVDLPALHADAKTQVYRTSTLELIDRLRAARAVSDDQSGYNQMFLIDYATRAMMIYPPDADMGRVTKDIKRLLRGSKID